ncbi:MAG: magnesium-translocating P-type ATPase [Candidatus Paceibacterota bacterium]|jgi:Mg2+-importing ATPase
MKSSSVFSTFESVFEELKIKGLTSSEAERRLKDYGKNVINYIEERALILEFLSKFKSPLIILLLVASLISIFTGNEADFFIILAMIFIGVVVDFYQEHQSQKAAERLREKVAVQTRVLRDGREKEIFIADVTVRDIVILAAGDVVPADLKILFSRDLHIDESALTGESFPAEKEVNDLGLMGTSVVNGEGIGEVLKIGRDTEFGKIGQKLVLQKPPTDFEIGVKQLGLFIMKLTVGLTAIIFATNLILRPNFFGESLLFALALAIGLTPELLPVIVTVNLSRGAARMLKKGVIVKHLPAIQNFGSMNVLCTDKTGTLTENKIKLERYENFQTKDDDKVLTFAYLNSFFQSNLKSALEQAILAHKQKVDLGKYEKIDEIPFDFFRKRLSVAVRDKKKTYLIAKGAPEELIQITTYYEQNGRIHRAGKEIKEKILARHNELSAQGFRVLMVAYRVVPGDQKTFAKNDERALIFLGLTAFMDPPKADVKEVIKTLHEEGVMIKILTGDNENVTRKVCEELEIPISGIISGVELVNFSEERLTEAALKNNIFVKLTPDLKERIILALKKSKQVVGYLGDGINDAPSLKAADVGISVQNAVAVAREAADLILVTKSLRVLHDGIYEGRRTFENTMKYIFMNLSSNFGNMLSISVASFILPFLPLLPTQIILGNLIYDLSQLTLPSDNVDVKNLKRPRKWNIDFIKKFAFTFGPISSMFDLVTLGALFYLFNSSTEVFRTGWFVESLVTQLLIVVAIRTRTVPFFKSRPSWFFVMSAVLGAALIIGITQTGIGGIFGFKNLPPTFWLFLVVVVVAFFFVIEAVKLKFYKIQEANNLKKGIVV